MKSSIQEERNSSISFLDHPRGVRAIRELARRRFLAAHLLGECQGGAQARTGFLGHDKVSRKPINPHGYSHLRSKSVFGECSAWPLNLADWRTHDVYDRQESAHVEENRSPRTQIVEGSCCHRSVWLITLPPAVLRKMPAAPYRLRAAVAPPRPPAEDATPGASSKISPARRQLRLCTAANCHRAIAGRPPSPRAEVRRTRHPHQRTQRPAQPRGEQSTDSGGGAPPSP